MKPLKVKASGIQDGKNPPIFNISEKK